MCPYCKQKCYGTAYHYYDTVQIVFDCGTRIDIGYGYYEPPKLYNNITIFKDRVGYTAWVPRSGWLILGREVPLPEARNIARRRLKQGGIIKER